MRLMDSINSYKTIYKPSGLCAANYARMQITLSRRALTRYTREAEAVLSLRVFALRPATPSRLRIVTLLNIRVYLKCIYKSTKGNLL